MLISSDAERNIKIRQLSTCGFYYKGAVPNRDETESGERRTWIWSSVTYFIDLCHRNVREKKNTGI